MAWVKLVVVLSVKRAYLALSTVLTLIDGSADSTIAIATAGLCVVQ